MNLERAELVLGEAVMQRLRSARVILFGVGGVGGWCAEALVRSGLGNITVVDPDVVVEHNVNRQVMALSSTIGRPKVEVLRERLLDINPEAKVNALQKAWDRDLGDTFGLDDYDYIVDAIDSLKDKINLIALGSRSGAKMFSSMGAACKVDPTRVRIAEFWEVRGCPLGSALRKKMRQTKVTTVNPVTCVYSDELIPNKWDSCHFDQDPEGRVEKSLRPNGSLVTVTATFGLTIASLIIQDIMNHE